MVWLFAAVLVGVIAITILFLRGADLRSFDTPRPSSLGERGQPSPAHAAVVESLGSMAEIASGGPRRQQLKVMRDYLDSMGEDVEFDGTITPVEMDGIKGEWVVAAGADTRRRMLYIHGGAWIMGSPKSHRAVTAHYAKMMGGAVFSLDYRLMPENTRQAGIDDCRAAWRWLLENGPEGASQPSSIFVSGDSAGGNLTLSLIAWIRDQGLRAPNAAVALSPATDATFSSPSMRDNVATDHMLGPQFGKLTKIPNWILHWGSWASNRIRPSHPSVSPVFDDLSGLPPTLIHASAAEMLLDDAVRYANKARAEGSPVDLQTWEDMVHVWHIFVADLPEAQHAFAEIDRFLKTHGATEQGAQAA
jgi:monoterpene epsilon-lactone hydrolase